MAGAATDARQTSSATRDTARAGILAAGTAADARKAALTARTAARPAVLAAGSAVAVVVAATAAWVVLEDDVRSRGGGRCWSSRKNFS